MRTTSKVGSCLKILLFKWLGKYILIELYITYRNVKLLNSMTVVYLNRLILKDVFNDALKECESV